jgi:hypothetical protein
MTASVRYDKQSVLEDGNFTPRLGFLFNLSENQNIRLTAQTGFRNPTNQDKFIGLNQWCILYSRKRKGSIDRFSTGFVQLVNGSIGSFTGNDVMSNSLKSVR